MGVDFITTCTPTFTRGWDIGLAAVQKADLFTDMPAQTSRTYRATHAAGAAIQDGDSVFLRSRDGGVAVIRGRTEVGMIRCPPASLTERLIENGRGIATGIVTKLYKLSGDFDVRVN